MVQKTTIILEDDIDGGPASETVTFGLDGVTYEIDLNDENAAKLRDALAVWTGHARRARRAAPATGRRPAQRRPGVAKEREWLRAHGYEVSSRGRIPANLREIYDAAQH